MQLKGIEKGETSKLSIENRPSVLERNLGIGKAIPLSSFAAKAISLQWLSAKRDF